MMAKLKAVALILSLSTLVAPAVMAVDAWVLLLAPYSSDDGGHFLYNAPIKKWDLHCPKGGELNRAVERAGHPPSPKMVFAACVYLSMDACVDDMRKMEEQAILDSPGNGGVREAITKHEPIRCIPYDAYYRSLH